MLGSVLHLSMFCKALVFKWKVWSKKGSGKKGQKLFCVFCQKKKKNLHFFYPKEEWASLLQFLKNVRKKARR